MKNAAWALLLSLLSVSVEAQQTTFSVRLFWQRPPTSIRVIPERAALRACDKCQERQLTVPVEVTAKGSTVLAGATAAHQALLTGQARISGDGFSPFSVQHELRIEARDDFLLLTLKMPLEEYVAAVLQGESATFNSDEALKAMAVAARTYAVHFGSRHRLEGFDFCDTTHCQDVRLGNESPRVRTAVATTEGQTLWFAGTPAATYYHRSCGGELEDASALESDLHLPYLKRHRDDYCARTPDEWQARISKADLSRALGRPVDHLKVLVRSDSGRVRRLLVDNRAMSATDFRFAVGRTLGWDKLRSDLYELEDLGDSVGFRGRGQGHGVGLCQAGAESMGEEGRSYREILAFYYPGTELRTGWAAPIARAVASSAATQRLWEKLPGESLDVITSNREDAAVLLPVAERALQIAQPRTGWNMSTRPQLRIYPTISAYRDETGEPGWVAASTRGPLIRLQPVSILRRTNSLDSTLRHEFLHILIESHARADAPLWLREGLAIYLTDRQGVKPTKVDVDALERQLHSLQTEADMRVAYRACAAAVAEIIQKNGLPAVLSRLEKGR